MKRYSNINCISSLALRRFLLSRHKRLDKFLHVVLKQMTSGVPRQLAQAMHYVILKGGKRLRPLLVYLIGEAYHARISMLDAPAAALEMLHTFSLVHDDLPAMDDDNLRRGQPACHLAFDEATAILTGDIFAVAPFSIISNAHNLTAEQKVAIIHVLSQAAGAQGLALGQYLDLHPGAVVQKQSKKIPQILKMYTLKTGVLFNAAIQTGAIVAGVASRKELSLLTQFAVCIGMAFQMHDDILNIEGNARKLGKNVGTDKKHKKNTYPLLMGMARAKQEKQLLWDEAQKILCSLSCDYELLLEFVRCVLYTEHG